MKNRKGIKIMAALLCASLLFGLGGCTDKPEPVPEPEPIDGGTTDHTDPNAPKVIQSKDIRAFYTNFYLQNRWWGEEERFYEFKIELDSSGVLTASETNSGVCLPADKALLDALQGVIDEYDLVSMNGLYRVTAGLPPEYQENILQVSYESGERLSFTINNEPEAKWAEAVCDVFTAWFSANGEDGLQPARETSLVTRLNITLREGSIYTQYGGIHVQAEDAIDGQEYLLEKSVYDDAAQETLFEEDILFPEDYYERVTEILACYDLVLKYEQSYFEHGDGYFGMGGKGPGSGEEDLEDRYLDLYAEFESGKRINIETKKASEIEGMKALLTELAGYHDGLYR